MDKPIRRSEMMLEMFLNLPSHESWKQNVIEEDISDLKDEGKMRLGKERMKPRCQT